MQDQRAQEQLARWGISETVAAQAGIFHVPDVRQIYPDMRSGAGIVIPYWTPAGELLTFTHGPVTKPFARVRWLDTQAPAGFVKRKVLRYTQPAHTGPQVYLPPILDWQAIAADVREPVIITEGEAKALAAAANGFRCLALGGVYSFTSPNGQLLPALQAFQWEQRHVYIAFDSDAASNPKVLAAEARLVDELQGKWNARCHIVRLPQQGEDKIGLDDFLRLHGPDMLEDMLHAAKPLSGIDAKVIAMNRTYAWIEFESAIYNLEAGMWVRKDSFLSGSLASSEKVVVMSGAKGQPKEVPISNLWLRHPHAQRYAEVLFRPGDGRTVHGDHGAALNLWDGWRAEPGDVAPWLRLTDYIFQRLEPDVRDLPLKLLAYKAQNPKEKVPLALVLIGTQGSGKTVWADSVRDAFAPYSSTPNPGSLSSEFQGWLEKSVIAVIHEMTPQHLHKSGEMMKALISDLRRPMNEKYRPVREIDSYTMYIFTSNLRGVGSYAGDDRRMIVVDIPPHGPDELYDEVWAWRKAGGPKALMHYLLSHDLKGWRPPQTAPLTAEKYLAAQEAKTPLQELAEQMLTADGHIIVQWLDAAKAWAQAAEISNNASQAAQGRAVAATVEQYQIRPWYTARELTMMFPAVVEQVTGSAFASSTPAGQVSRLLREAGVPYLVNKDDPRGFRWGGHIQQFLVVSDPAEWAKPIGQADFERQMKMFPTYRAWKKGGGR